VRPTSLNLGPPSAGEFQLLSAFSNPIIPSATILQPQQNSQVYNSAYQSNSSTNILSNSNMNSSTSNSTIYSSYASPSPGIDGIRNMDIFTERPYYNSPTAPADETYMYNGTNNNNVNSNYGTPRLYSSYAASYSSALSDSLAETPGISVAPMGFVAEPAMSFGPSSSAANNCKLEVSEVPLKLSLLPIHYYFLCQKLLFIV